MSNRPPHHIGPQQATQDPAGDRPTAERSWVRPVLVEYGHLAKLTRGGSGTITEPTNRMKCL